MIKIIRLRIRSYKKKCKWKYCKKRKKEATENKAISAFIKLWRLEKDDVHRKSFTAKKAEKSCIQELKKLKKQSIAISSNSKNFIPIENSESEWKATNIIWQTEEKKRRKEAERKKAEKKKFFCLE